MKIAIGRSKKELKWKNVDWSWEQLTAKLKDTFKTRETVEEYKKMSKSSQDSIKDVGGFVGGWLDGGRRKSNTVINRSMLTLDADFAKPTFWDDLITIQDFKCCIYSTHKHTPNAPRIRLIIPLKRDVSAEEYEAIARMVAKDIGIDMFDDTTYQPSRLMYWPSTPKNGQFVYEEQDGDVLDPDEVLKRYHDWRDVSFWPQSSRVQEIHVKQAKKQGDPLEKDGLIGAFCRTYDIHQAIESFLSEVYEPTNSSDRYTYTKGSTAAGLVVYEDKWAYSNHGTDPASGRLCNAFDLVRIHMFGEEDDSAKDDTPVNKLPSYIKMMDFIANDDETKAENLKEMFATVDIDYEFDETEEDTDFEDWIKKLDTDRKGSIISSRKNIDLILNKDKFLKSIRGLNRFSGKVEIVGKLPWYKQKAQRSWIDADSAGLRNYLERVYKIEGKEKIKDVFSEYVRCNEFHPVKDYLDGLKWDGVERIDKLLIDYLGAEDCEYTRIVTRRWLIGAVARIYQPGCKMDNALILVGKQGAGKSTLAQKLAVDLNWFTDTKMNYGDKSALEQIRGKWIVELQELAGMYKADAATVKAFISGRMDSYRAAYRENTEDIYRQCVFIGTVNEVEFLRDTTGNRRFWPVDTQEVKNDNGIPKTADLKVDDVKQIWAEAKSAYMKGESWYADSELDKLAREIQEAHVESNPLTSMIEDYLNQELPASWEDMKPDERIEWFKSSKDERAFIPPGGYYRDRVTLMEVWTECLKEEPSKLKSTQARRELKDAMATVKGWEYRVSIKFKDHFMRGYIKV